MGAHNSHERETNPRRDKRLKRNAAGDSYRQYKANRPRAATVPPSGVNGGHLKDNSNTRPPRDRAQTHDEIRERSMDTKTQIEYKPKVLSQSEKESFDSKFQPFFEKVAGADGEIDAFELQAVLNSAFKKEMNGKSFSLEACRSMVAMVDRDRNGKLDYEEFRTMWTTVMRYKSNFAQYDKDKSGDMSATELRDALAKLGFKLSTPVLSSLTLRYANKKGQVNIDDYLQICCRVKSSFESYLSYQGKSFSLDDYIMSAVYT